MARNSGARMSWKMIPLESRSRTNSDNTVPPTADEVSTELTPLDFGVKDKEVVLREVEDERPPPADSENRGRIFSSIVTISSTTALNY